MTESYFDWTQLPPVFEAPEEVPIVDRPPQVASVPSDIVFSPRDYQLDSADSTWREWDSGKRSTLVIMATGGGKTIIFGMVAKRAIEDRQGRVLVLAHRDELLQQAQDKLAFVGVHSVIEKAALNAREQIDVASRDWFNKRDVRCVVGSVQSMKGKRLESWPKDYFGYVICDEAHHSSAVSYKNIFNHFAVAKFLGVTATPARADKKNIGSFYESIAVEYSLPWMIDHHWLAPITWSKSEVQVDLRMVNATAGDLNQGDLEDAIGPHIERMVRAVKWKRDGTPHLGNRRAILFAPGRKSTNQKLRPAEMFADGLRKVGISASAIWGDHPDRIAIVRGFRAGEFQVLCGTPNLLGEGVDFPFLEAGILACPTKSAGAFCQMVGRTTRLCEETGKKDALVIDFDWLIEKHKLASAFDLVRPRGSNDDASSLTKKILESGEETDLIKAVALAEARVAEEARKRQEAEARRKAQEQSRKEQEEERQRAKRQKQERQREKLHRDAINLRVKDGDSKLGFKQFDPFAKATTLAGVASSNRGTSEKPTEAQLKKLAKDYGIPQSELASLDRQGAEDMLLWAYNRYKDGKAPLWVVRDLLKMGVSVKDALSYSQRQAFAVRDEMRRQNNKPWYSNR